MTKRVLFFINSMAGGGAERTLVELMKSLNRDHFDLHLALYAVRGELLDSVPADVPIIDVSGFEGRRSAFSRSLHLYRTIKGLDPDVIVSSMTPANCDLLRLAPLLRPGCRIIVTEQNNLTLNLRHKRGRVSRLVRMMEVRFLYRWADKIIVCSQGIKDDLTERFGLDSHNIEVVYNPVNNSQVQATANEEIGLPWEASDSRKILIATGRLVRQKAYPDLLHAFAQVRSQIPCWLVILGDGELRSDLESLAQQLEISDDVYMPGFVANPWAYMRRGDIYVSTSHWEGFHLTLVEAMACGTAVIATDCDFGPREIITPGVNGILVRVGDREAIAAGILRLLRDDSLRSRLGAMGQVRARQFDSELISRRYAHIIAE